MAIVKDNILTTGLSGKLGKQLIFKQSGRKTVLALAPEAWPSRTSPAQIQKQNRFREAIAFAKGVLSDPVLLKKYEDLAGESRTAYHAALSDFLTSGMEQTLDSSKTKDQRKTDEGKPDE